MVSIAQSYYCDIEKGNKKPSVSTAKKIAFVLDFDWTKFFNEKQ